MCGSRKFCQRGSNLDNFFFDEGEREEPTKYYYKRAIFSPPAKRHLNADDGPTLNVDLVAL